MKLIFSSFTNYTNANEAIKSLLKGGISSDRVNAIIAEKILDKISIENGSGKNRDEYPTLDNLIDKKNPLYTSGLGIIFATGQLAYDMIRTAPVITGDGIRSALHSFLPEDVSDFYFTTVQNGGVLVWIQSDDEVAERTAVILKEKAGQKTITLE